MANVKGEKKADEGLFRAKSLKDVMKIAPFVTHNIPKFPRNSQIVGLCNVPFENAGNGKQGWMISDFLAFKSLLKAGVVTPKENQVWFSSIDFKNVFDTYGVDYIHGHTDPKNVVDAADDNKFIILEDSKDLLQDFKHAIAMRSRIAESQNKALIIIVCGPVTPEQDIIFHLENELFLTTVEIRGAMAPSARVILLTNSAFSGGWLVNPRLAGNFPDQELTDMVKLVAQNCGSAFAPALIDRFTMGITPLLTDEERERVKYPANLMPVNPSETQVNKLHAFHLKIQGVLQQKMSSLGLGHEFNFSDEHFTWKVLGSNAGPPPGFWEKIWDELKPAISVIGDGYDFLGTACGNSRASQLFHVQFLAKLDRLASPGDFDADKKKSRPLLLLDTFMSRDATDPKLRDWFDSNMREIFDILEFRSANIMFADMIVKYCELPLPQEVTCRFYSYQKDTGRNRVDSRNNIMNQAWGLMAQEDLFGPMALPPGRNRMISPPFWSPAWYIASALSMKFTRGDSTDHLEDFVKSRILVFKDLVNIQDMILAGTQPVVDAGTKWLASINLKKGHFIDTEQGKPPAKPEQPISAGAAAAGHEGQRLNVSAPQQSTFENSSGLQTFFPEARTVEPKRSKAVPIRHPDAVRATSPELKRSKAIPIRHPHTVPLTSPEVKPNRHVATRQSQAVVPATSAADKLEHPKFAPAAESTAHPTGSSREAEQFLPLTEPKPDSQAGHSRPAISQEHPASVTADKATITGLVNAFAALFKDKEDLLPTFMEQLSEVVGIGPRYQSSAGQNIVAGADSHGSAASTAHTAAPATGRAAWPAKAQAAPAIKISHAPQDVDTGSDTQRASLEPFRFPLQEARPAVNQATATHQPAAGHTISGHLPATVGRATTTANVPLKENDTHAPPEALPTRSKFGKVEDNWNQDSPPRRKQPPHRPIQW